MNAPLCDPLLLPFVADVLDRLDDGQREYLGERAGVLEFDASCQPRALAEALALIEMLRRWPHLLTGVQIVEVELSGSRQWLMTTDLNLARRRVAAFGGQELVPVDVLDLVQRQYDGVCLLSPLCSPP